MVVGVSYKGQEVGILGRGLQDKNRWEIWSLEDSSRAEFPLTDDQENTYPMGLCIDLTSQYEIPIGKFFRKYIIFLSTFLLLISDKKLSQLLLKHFMANFKDILHRPLVPPGSVPESSG
jgi:hypothetical protein